MDHICTIEHLKGPIYFIFFRMGHSNLHSVILCTYYRKGKIISCTVVNEGLHLLSFRSACNQVQLMIFFTQVLSDALLYF